jgi:hypothetical protein
MERLVETVGPAAEALVAVKAFVEEFGRIAVAVSSAQTTPPTTRKTQPRAPQLPPPAPVRERYVPPVRASSNGNGDVSGPQQRILNALASLENIGVPAPAKVQLALFAEASPKSSSFSNNLGHLNNQLGLISYPQPGRVALTDAGRDLSDAGHAPSTAAELHSYVFGLVGQAKTRLLEQLIVVHPEALSKAELAERSGASASSSSFSNNLGSLRSLGLIDYPSPGMIAARDVLFL